MGDPNDIVNQIDFGDGPEVFADEKEPVFDAAGDLEESKPPESQKLPIEPKEPEPIQEAAPETKDPAEPPVEHSHEPTTEDMARAIGWRPKEEWKGHPDKWLSAEEYLEKGNTLLPIMKADREKLFKKVNELEGKLNAWNDHHTKDRKRVAERAYKKALTDLKAQQLQAVEEGDRDAYLKLEDQREEIEKDYKEGTEEPAAEPEAKDGGDKPKTAENEHPEFQAWRDNNRWYDDKPLLKAYADANIERIAQQTGLAPGPKLWDAVKADVARYDPTAFSNPRRTEPSSVEGGDNTNVTGPSGKKTLADVPHDIRAEHDRMVRAGMSSQQWIDEFFGEDDNEMAVFTGP